MEPPRYPTCRVDGEEPVICLATIPALLEALGEMWVPRRRRKRDALHRARLAETLGFLALAARPLADYAVDLIGHTDREETS